MTLLENHDGTRVERLQAAILSGSSNLVTRSVQTSQHSQAERIQLASGSTLILVTLAAAALTAARVEQVASLTWLYSTTIVAVAFAWVAHFLLSSTIELRRRVEAVRALVFIAWVLIPVLLEFMARRMGFGESPEIIMVCLLYHTALASAMFGHQRRSQQLACLLSAFLVLFVIIITPSILVLALSGCYGVVLLWWMMASYWEKIQRVEAVGQSTKCLPIRTGMMVGVSAASIVLLGSIATNQHATRAIQGFLPTSGGTRWHDEFARSGIGNGDAMVAAKDDASTFGPVESELFLDSQMPSLYDMFNDQYGEPPNAKKKFERAIGLDSDEVKQTMLLTSRNEQNRREFSLVRRNQERTQENTIRNNESAAMLYVIGRVPVHLALERYDSFDGDEWTQSGEPQVVPRIFLTERFAKPWAHFCREGSSNIHRGTESHAIKFINLKSNRVPSPPHLMAVHVDKVNQLDFYGWTEDGVASMPIRDQIPQLTVMHLRSQGVNLQSLREHDFTQHLPTANRAHSQTDGSAADILGQSIDRFRQVTVSSNEIKSTAQQWARDVPRGWRQVEAVVAQLRSEFTHDKSVEAPDACEDVVTFFLEEKRGPDYMFASTAAVLLRELGYPTRLVTGFYARPDRYDRLSGQTSVLADDVHVWVEVNVDGRTWLPIEPTPGYQPPAEHLSLGQWVAYQFGVAMAWCRDHWAALTLVGLALGTLLVSRLWWLDFAGQVFCFLLGKRSAESRVVWTIRLIEWRAWLAGCPRPKRTTIAAWIAPLIPTSSQDNQSLLRGFLQWSDRVLYSNKDISKSERQEVEKACSVMTSTGRRRAIRAFVNTSVSSQS